MGPITKFIVDAWTDGIFEQEHTPDSMLEALMVRPGAADANEFIRHAAKTAFANLNVCEMLCGKIAERKLANRGEDYLMDRTIAQPLDERVALVVHEAKWWDYLRAKAEQERAA